MNAPSEHPQFRDGWTTCRLADVCEYPVERVNPQCCTNGHFSYIDISSIDTRTKRITSVSRVATSDAPSRARQLIKPEDILISTTRPNLNAVALVEEQYSEAIASTGFCVLRPTITLDPSFLYYFVRTAEFIESISSKVTGALYPAVTDRQVLGLDIPLPPLSEQKRIVAILNEQMAAVEKARAAAEAQLEAAKALPAAYLREVFSFRNDSEDLRSVTSSSSVGNNRWRTVRLGELCSFIRGVSFDPSEASNTMKPNHLPILRAGNIQNTLIYDKDLVWVPRERVVGDQLLVKGDIAVCMSSGSKTVVGKVAQCKEDWVGSVGAFCGILRPNSSVDSDYFAQWLHSDEYIGWRLSVARGANIQNLRFSEMASIELALPPLPEQKRIVAILNDKMKATSELIESAESQISHINALPSALLRQAFSGVL